MSNVPANRRNPSDVDYFHNAYIVNDLITKFLLSDFGIKRSSKELRVFAYEAKMDDKDIETFSNIVDKYNLGLEVNYPMWLIDYYRTVILNTMFDAIQSIAFAESIFPTSMYLFNLKKQYQQKAICDYYCLLHELQTVIFTFKGNVNMEKYIPFIPLIKEEIDALKVWKNDTNKFKKSCIINDEKAQIHAQEVIVKEQNKIKNKKVEILPNPSNKK